MTKYFIGKCHYIFIKWHQLPGLIPKTTPHAHSQPITVTKLIRFITYHPHHLYLIKGVSPQPKSDEYKAFPFLLGLHSCSCLKAKCESQLRIFLVLIIISFPSIFCLFMATFYRRNCGLGPSAETRVPKLYYTIAPKYNP